MTNRTLDEHDMTEQVILLSKCQAALTEREFKSLLAWLTELNRYQNAVDNCEGGSLVSCSCNFNDEGPSIMDLIEENRTIANEMLGSIKSLGETKNWGDK